MTPSNASLQLLGLGHFHPETEITNRFLEELDIGTNDEWIMERVGIRSRRTVLPLDYIRATRNRDPRAALEASTLTQAELGRRAAEMALARAGVSSEDVGLVIAGASCSDWSSPAEACAIACALGIEAPALDVNSACTSLFAQLWLLSCMRPEALPDVVLLVAPEALTRVVDYADRTASVIWGDGAAAAVVSFRRPGAAEILDHTLASSPAGFEKVVVPRLGHFAQDGRAVQLFAIKKTIALLRTLQARFLSSTRRLHFVGHQANLRMLENVCRSCDVPDDLHHSNVEHYGNTAAASAASVVSMRWEKWQPGDDVALVGVGSGLTWSSALLRFGAAA
jgi:3-oxoacyl-[acyl-carrier-protein] synthase-3